MLKKLIILTILIISTPTFADKAADIAEFNAAYAEYLELVEVSENIDAAIIVGEKIYSLAPRIYGRKSAEFAVATYNLAGLYDEKGGEEKNKEEEKAANLYEKYFRIQNLRKITKDINYLNQYIPYMIAYYNAHPIRSKNSISDNLLDIAYSLDLSNLDIANIEYLVAINRVKNNRLKYSKQIFRKASQRYQNEYGAYHFKVAETLFWVAKIDIANGHYEDAEQILIQVIDVLNNLEKNYTTLKNSGHHLLATVYNELGKIDLLEENYKLIDTTKDKNKYVIPVHKPKFHYPKSMMLSNVNITIAVKYDIGIDGIPKNIIPINGWSGLYDKEAINAAKKIRYYPPFINGQSSELRGVEDYIILISWNGSIS